LGDFGRVSSWQLRLQLEHLALAAFNHSKTMALAAYLKGTAKCTSDGILAVMQLLSCDWHACGIREERGFENTRTKVNETSCRRKLFLLLLQNAIVI
jgi:hypothetical protein